MMPRRIKYSVAALLTTTILGLTASVTSAQTTKTVHYATKIVCETAVWNKSMPKDNGQFWVEASRPSGGATIQVSSTRIVLSWEAAAGWNITFPNLHLARDGGGAVGLRSGFGNAYNNMTLEESNWNNASITACHMASTAPAALTLIAPAKLVAHQAINLTAVVLPHVAGRLVYLQQGGANWKNVFNDNGDVYGRTNKFGRVTLQLPTSYTGIQPLRALAVAANIKGKHYPRAISTTVVLTINY